MSRRGRSTQADGSDVCEVCTSWLLVDRAEVELAVPQVVRGVDSVEVDDRERSEKDLGWWFHEATALAIPACSVQVQTIHIHTLCWRLGHIFLHHTSHVVVE